MSHVSRLPQALLLALIVHSAVLWVLFIRAPTPPVRRPYTEQLVELVDSPAVSLAASNAVDGTSALTRGAATSVQVPRAAGRATARVTTGSSTPQPEDDLRLATPDASLGETVPTRPVDLGLDGHLLLGSANQLGPRRAPPAMQQSGFEAALLADDLQRGLARGNVLVGLLESAAASAGPLSGQAVVRITASANGGVIGVDLVEGNDSEWAAALRSFLELGRHVRLRVPSGAQGLRVTFRVSVHIQRPSGQDTNLAPARVAPPSFKPDNFNLHGVFDFADTAGGGRRMTRVRIESEEIL